MRWILTPFLRYADFKGRSGRAEFWVFFGLSVAMIVFVVSLTGLTTETTNPEKLTSSVTPSTNASPTGAIIYIIWWFASIVPWIAVQVRRLHDQGRSGWLVLIGLGGYVAAGFGVFPLAALLFAASLALMALKGEAATNAFGPAIGEQHADISTSGEDHNYDVVDEIDVVSKTEITRGQDGRFYLQGRAFGTLADAERAARHLIHANKEAIKRARVGVASSVHSNPEIVIDRSGNDRSDADTLHNHSEHSDVAEIKHSDLEPGIKIGRDGRFYVHMKGNFSTLEEARNANQTTSGDVTVSDSVAEQIDSGVFSVEPAVPSSTDLPADVKLAGDGRYSCGGYTFNHLEQALSFSRRRNARAEAPLQSSPMGFHRPTPQPPKPSFFGFAKQSTGMSEGARWVAEPTTLEAGGVQFDANLLYFGTIPKNRRYERHSSLIDPSLSVSNGRDPEGSTFSYWPNYSELRPEARRSYLEWLADGRRNPDTPIGYVFIYFYGLERRLVKDRSEADAPAIMDELRRLLAIYGNNGSFRGYCGRLLDFADVLHGDTDSPPVPTLDNRSHWELPIRLRVHLGKKVAAGSRLDANDALCWTLGHPQLYPRTSVTRCFDQFCELWKIRFQEHFPSGLSVREPKARLQFQYRSASSEFTANATIENLPDVGAINGPISKFDQMLGSCGDELDPLSRFLGRNPAENDSIIAGALLPEPLRRNENDSAFGRFCRSLQTSTNDTGLAEVGIGDLISQMGLPATSAKDDRRALHLKRLPELLDAANFGFEPDKRFGPSPTISEDLTICVFPAKNGGAVNANRPEYQAARTMAEIAALAARSDDLVVEAEVQSIAADLISFDGISDLDRTRLRAHASALLANPSKVKAATKRLTELPEAERQAALASAVRAVLADQRISPAEVRFLEGLYKALGLPQDEVYSRLHSGDVVAPKPQTKALDKTGAVSGSAESGAVIDEAKLARLQQETSAVSTMLASIFKEEEIASKVPEVEPETASAAISGLDLAHSKVLSRLADAPMEADTFGELCRELKLLPSGAIETINDWAFDALDDYAIEEGELISIQEHLIEPIKAMRSEA